MSYKIGVFGSGGGSISEDAIQAKARDLGQALAKVDEEIIVVTGGCSGLPYLAASVAAQNGRKVWGFTPVFNESEQRKFTPEDDLSIYAKLVYMPKEFSFADNQRVCMKYRNVISTATCDAGIVISGRWGSLNEFTNLVDMQKVIGVLTSTGGIADELPALAKKISKAGQGTILFNDDPAALVEDILKELRQKKS